MYLNGMINGGAINDSPRPSASGGDRVPGANQRSGAFDGIVARARPRQNANSAHDQPRATDAHQTEPEAGTPPGQDIEATDPASESRRAEPEDLELNHNHAAPTPGQSAPAEAPIIVQTPVLPDDGLPAVAPALSIPGMAGQSGVPVPARPAGAPAPAPPGVPEIVFSAMANAPVSAATELAMALGEGSPGKNALPASVLPHLGVEAEVPPPLKYSGLSSAQSAETDTDTPIASKVANETAVRIEGKLQRLAGAPPTPGGGQVTTLDMTTLQSLPQTSLQTGQQPASTRPAPSQPRERSVQRPAPPWGSLTTAAAPPVEDGNEVKTGMPAPVLAALNSMGSVAPDPMTQILSDSERSASAATPATPTQLLAGLTSGIGAPAGSPEVARIVAPQIAVAIGSNPGSGRIEIRLDPPELGNVGILIEVTDQSLRATLIAERPATSEMLRRHSEILLAQLQQAGFSSIDLQFAGNRAGEQGGARHSPTPRSPFADSARLPHRSDAADAPERPMMRTTTDGLDLRL